LGFRCFAVAVQKADRLRERYRLRRNRGASARGVYNRIDLSRVADQQAAERHSSRTRTWGTHTLSNPALGAAARCSRPPPFVPCSEGTAGNHYASLVVFLTWHAWPVDSELSTRLSPPFLSNAAPRCSLQRDMRGRLSRLLELHRSCRNRGAAADSVYWRILK
jgi:hypothetical protein